MFESGLIVGKAWRVLSKPIALFGARWYARCMAKRKATITLSELVLRQVDQLAGKGGNRSEVIETALVSYLEMRRRENRDKKDRALLDEHAKALNREADDVLEYQVTW